MWGLSGRRRLAQQQRAHQGACKCKPLFVFCNIIILILTISTLQVMKMRSDDLEITEKHAQQLFKRFDVGKPIEVYDVADRYQLDVVSEVFFGESADSLTGHHPFRDPMETLHPINTARMLFGKNAYYVKDKYLAPKALKELNGYTSGIVDRAYARDLSKKSPEDYNMLDDLVSQKKSVKVSESS